MTVKQQTTRLRITSCSAVYQGEHPNGHRYTIFEIEASKHDGSPVTQQLRSFEELPVGEVLDLTVKKYDQDGSYTLYRRGGSGNAKKIKQLEQRVARIEQVLGMEVPEHATS